MTEVTAKYKLFLAVGMVVTGTLNTISTKERFQFNFCILIGQELGTVTLKYHRLVGNKINHLET